MIRERVEEWKEVELPIWLVIYPEGTRKTPQKLLMVCF
jgi:1-acyl-sn-glycerol-3-phosphate acyltransferase